MKPGETPAVYVDVDGTLLLWPGKSPGSPRYALAHGLQPEINVALVTALRKWHRGDRVLVLWSRGGTKACQHAATLCGLTPDACLPKPRIIIDDSRKSVTEGTGFDLLGPRGPFNRIFDLTGE